MIRSNQSSRSTATLQFDPFMPEESAELELVDLMSYVGALDLPQAAPAATETQAMRHHLGLTLPRWDQLEPQGVYARLVKPIMPIVMMLAALPIALAIMLPIALVNWFVTGDWRLIFYTQERVGQYGRVFRIFKFRTMRPINEGRDFEAWQAGDQNRVTTFGRFLRSTHLDEVPQILNILFGDMDFIGPRPEMVEIHNWACDAVPGFERRLALRPGITGLAQITQGYAGQCAEAYAAKLAADDEYRETLSARLDFKIVLRTFVWMARGRGWSWNKG